MCTALHMRGERALFGRTLDFEAGYGERIAALPRNYELRFLYEENERSHPAMIGTACIKNGVPLFFDAQNEAGVAAAGLNFPGYAVYDQPTEGKINLASFEVIPWVLCNSTSVRQAVSLLKKANITCDSVSPELPHTPLHWMIADKKESVVAESTAEGFRIYENPVGVLTNSPSFPYHLARLREYSALSPFMPKNELCPDFAFTDIPRGSGACGLPGDWSSSSRFIRAVFTKNHTVPSESASGAVSDFFHIAESVSLPFGCVRAEDGGCVKTRYTSCFDLTEGVYYYTTYENRRIRAIDFGDLEIGSDKLVSFPMDGGEDILHFCD